MKYLKTIKDDVGNEHKRRNLYLKDLADGKKVDKRTHPYIKKLNDYHDKEKKFLEKLKADSKEYESTLSDDSDIKKIRVRLFKAKAKFEFYQPFISLTYDAQLEAEVAAHELRYIPDILENNEALKASLVEKRRQLSEINEAERTDTLKSIEEYKSEREKELAAEIALLKDKKREGFISAKALKNEVKILKRKAKEDIQSDSYRDPKKSIEEEIKNIEHHLKIDPKTQLSVMSLDISDTRRKTPIEVEKTFPIISFLTILFPGVGQLFNKQFVKGFFFLLSSLFIYFIAIPYFLGYGNFQGEGIFGLVTLAKGGAKIDRSIIFLIEGVIAIALMSIALLLFFLSFKDVYSVEKGKMRGIRHRNWFETRQGIEREGFPYLVSVPAYLVILFIVIVPIMTTILISFTNLDPRHQNKFAWIGVKNYLLILKGEGIAGGAFWLILWWTIVWTICATTLAIFIGFVLSLLVNQERVKGKGFFRTIYLLPWAVPAFITIMFFSLMLANNGPMSEFINSIFGTSIDIKSNPTLTRLSLILIQGWLGSSYIFLLSTGILQGIPNDLYEAAEIDGAKGIKKTLYITIPLVLFQTAPLLIGQYTFNFNNFSIIHLFNGGGPFLPSKYGNLAGASDLLISYIFKLTITNKYQAIGAAITVFISLVLMFISYLGFRRTHAFKED